MLVSAQEDGYFNFQVWSLSYPGGEARKITNDSNNYKSISLPADASAIISVKAEQEAAAVSAKRAEDMEERLRESTSEVDRVKVELEKQRVEQGRLESEWHEKLNAAGEVSKKLEAAWQEDDQRNKGFEKEIAGLRQTRDELSGMLTAEQ